MNEFEEFIKNLNLTEEEIKLFNEKNIVSDRVKRMTDERFKGETFEKSGAPAGNEPVYDLFRGASVYAVIDNHNSQIHAETDGVQGQEADRRRAQLITSQMAMVAVGLGVSSRMIGRGNWIPSAIMLSISGYLRHNPNVSSMDLVHRIVYAAGAFFMSMGATIGADYFGYGEHAVILGGMVFLALTARTAIQGAVSRDRVTIDGVEQSPTTTREIADIVRDNDDTEDILRRVESQQRRSRGRNRRRLTYNGVRPKRSTSRRNKKQELDKNNIKF